MTDYISREAALRDWPLCDEPADAYQYIRNFPAADVRSVVRGKWVITTERFAPERICSSCNCRFPVSAGEGITEVLNFCPNCGADMREES